MTTPTISAIEPGMKAMEEIAWFHRIRLQDGRETPGISALSASESHFLFDRIDFAGRSVLDIGGWDGKFTFLSEQRGATRNLCLDDPAFRWGGLEGWDFLHHHFASRARWMKGNVYQMPPEFFGEARFDVVLFYGVIYHLSDPLLALINCFRASRDRVAIEGNLFRDPRPLLLLAEAGEMLGDGSNVFCASSGFVEAVARQCGFRLEASRLRRRGIGYLGLDALRSRKSRMKDRGALLFRRVEEREAAYHASCFPPVAAIS